MSIDIPLTEFDRSGGLTTYGQELFWKEVDRALRKFDADKIKLLPRGPQNLQHVPATHHEISKSDRTQHKWEESH